MEDKTQLEIDIEYINNELPKKCDSDFYYDNPGAAIDDIQFLIEIVNKLKNG